MGALFSLAAMRQRLNSYAARKAALFSVKPVQGGCNGWIRLNR
jgi:hypothetical protein